MNKKNPLILQINTYGTTGGAGKAAFRLHKGLLAVGTSSRYLVKTLENPDPGVIVVSKDPLFEKNFVTDSFINKYYIWFNRTELSNTYFSFSYPGYDISEHESVRAADILNFHWVDDFLSPWSLHKLFYGNKPTVWTLHDQKPFTGGCHYSSGCVQYQTGCIACPQLSDDPFGLPAAALADKRDLFKGANLTIVTPSKWLAKEARNSTLFRDCRIEAIPNSVETDVYCPIEKAAAKEALGIDPQTITLMFGTVDAKEARKGLLHAMNAINFCLQNPEFKKLLALKKINLICVGKIDPLIKTLSLPVRDFGFIASDSRMAAIYNAADIFILPSLEDNLPNTMLEAMACGTPVIAFDTGGISDVIADGLNGRLIEHKNDRQLGCAIIDMIRNPENRKSFGDQAAKLIRNNFKLSDQAKNYKNLYDELLKEKRVNPIPFKRGPYGENTKKIYRRLLRFAFENALIVKRSQPQSKYLRLLMYYGWLCSIELLPHSLFVRIKNFFLKMNSH